MRKISNAFFIIITAIGINLFILLSLSIAGYNLFKDFCENISEVPVPHLKFYEEVSASF